MHGFSSKMNENRKVEMWCRHQKHLGIMLLEDSERYPFSKLRGTSQTEIHKLEKQACGKI